MSKNYGTNTAVQSLSFALKEHEFLAILGPSGCGKSTALRMIAGFEKLDAGQIKLNNATVSEVNHTVPAQNRKIGMVFQDIALFPHLSVAENIIFGLKSKKPEKQMRLREMLELIGLEDISHKMPHMISGGEQQRVAIARALAPSPQMILLDEPFSSLDYQLRVQLRNDFQNILKKEQVSTILVTHDQEEAFLFADRILVMNRGKLVQVGTAEDIYHSPANPWVASFVGDANFLPIEIFRSLIQADSDIKRFSVLNSGKERGMFRPEDVDLNLTNTSDYDGKIMQIQFSGDQQIIMVQLKSGEIVKARLPSREAWKVGSTVTLVIKHGIFYEN